MIRRKINSETLKFRFSEFVLFLASKTRMVFVAILVAFYIFYGGIAYTETIYSWTKTMGGTSTDEGYSATVDRSGNVYVTGYFRGTADFDPDPVATDEYTSVGGEDIFILRINSDGSYGWTKTMGGTEYDSAVSGVVDRNGDLYVTGVFKGTADFDPDPVATDEHTSAGEHDIFLTKINADGSYGWTKTMGGTDYDSANSVAVDSSGNVYVTGRFYGTVDFDPDPDVEDEHTSGIFLTMRNADSSYCWTKSVSAFQIFGYSITVDSSGNIYWTGSFQGTADFDPDLVAKDEQTSTEESIDIFLTKFLKESAFNMAMPWIPLLLLDD